MDIGIEQQALKALEEVVELPRGERARYITQMGNAQVASRVTQLLRALDELDDDDNTEVLGFEIAPVEGDLAGTQVGAYRLEEMVGRGGMGVVYRAARTDGAFNRDVAIKFFSTIAPEVLRRRFSNERQLLARLQHPNIAGLIDGGSIELHGQMQPYLVMEYVQGETFDFVAGRTQKQTLQLFARVCAAVHYAHTQLVLHRDIKPANVKLDQRGEPKLLDFGVAKLLDTEELASLTQFTPAAFTFNFTAPEVLEGEPASIVSDVYSLGVYLHVLVHGRTPYDVAGLAFPAMLKKLRDSLSAVSKGGSEKGGREKGGSEIDAIIAKAMHEDPQRRYPSAASLEEDLQRLLSGHPITARGDDWRYRAGRFVRRHALAVSVGVLGISGLSTTTAAALYQAQAASLAQASTQRTLNFVQSMFSAADPRSGEPLGPEASLSDLLHLAEKLARDSFAEDKATQLNVYLLLADTWLGMEQLNSVQAMLERSEAIYAAEGPGLANYHTYTELLHNLRISLAISGTQWRDAVAECTQLPHLASSVAANFAQLSMQIGCANAYVNVGEAAESAKLAHNARLGLADATALELTEYQLLKSYFTLANVFLGLGDNDATVEYMDLAEASAQNLGESGLASLALIYVMKSILPNQLGQAEESLHFTQLAMETAESSPLTPDQVLYAYVQLYHADRLIDVKRLDDAEAAFANARHVLLTQTPNSSHYHATTHFTEYKLAYLAQDYPRAEQALLTAKDIRSQGGEAYTPWQATSDYGLGKIYLAQGRYAKAAEHITRAYDYYAGMLGADHPKVAQYAATLAEAQSAAP